jgi:hypothetical protein
VATLAFAQPSDENGILRQLTCKSQIRDAVRQALDSYQQLPQGFTTSWGPGSQLYLTMGRVLALSLRELGFEAKDVGGQVQLHSGENHFGLECGICLIPRGGRLDVSRQRFIVNRKGRMTRDSLKNNIKQLSYFDSGQWMRITKDGGWITVWMFYEFDQRSRLLSSYLAIGVPDPDVTEIAIREFESLDEQYVVAEIDLGGLPPPPDVDDFDITDRMV